MSELIRWNEGLSTCIAIVDDQHKELIRILNESYTATLKPHSPEDVKKMVTDIVEYALMHFETEESIMRNHRFYDLDNHIHEHQAFWAEVRKFTKKILAGETVYAVELLAFIANWLGTHVTVTDKRLREIAG